MASTPDRNAPSGSSAGPPLPGPYAPFAPVLERLSAPLQQVLNGQLLQFERLVRTFDVLQFAPHGEFEGLDGLTMSGEIAHIVQSELLLRTEVPMEFLRRLAEGETLYQQKSYADPGARSVYRAMVSIGPGVLGHGRLVILAALFFLARVARERGAEFHWCCLPRAEGPIWFEDVSVNVVKRFMRAVSHREATEGDVAEAQAVWARLEPAALVRDRPLHVDWILGGRAWAAIPMSAGKPVPAVARAANTLSFSLNAPARDEPRRVDLHVRRSGKDLVRTELELPEDDVCASAIENPFKSFKPIALKGARGVPPHVPGWEPLYFFSPVPGAKLVRMKDGVLLIVSRGKSRIDESWFVPVPDTVKLAGIQLDGLNLSIAVQAMEGSREIMAFRRFRMGVRDAHILSTFALEMPTRHLFRNQRPYSIPPLFSSDYGFEICSTSGQAFDFQPGHEGGRARFQMLHSAPKTLHADGAYRTVRAEVGGEPVLRVLKKLRRLMCEFREGPERVTSERLRGMVFSASEMGLAYSIAPRRWVVPPCRRDDPHLSSMERRLGRDTAREVVLEPHETLLGAAMAQDGVKARIWSDARYGGEGTIVSGLRQGSSIRLRQAPIRLGEDAMWIARIVSSDDGYWAVTTDADGAPRELLQYRILKRKGIQDCRRLDLTQLARQATRIELGPFNV